MGEGGGEGGRGEGGGEREEGGEGGRRRYHYRKSLVSG